MKNLALHWKILIGMALGVVFGLIMANFDFGKDFISDWIKPFGTIFINSLKLIAIPLILASLIKGISDLKDITKLSKMGGATIAIYMITTLIAVSIGLIVVNVIKPGDSISDETRIELINAYESDADQKRAVAEDTKNSGPLQALIDVVPSNIVSAASDNKNMLQVIFFSILFGIAMILIPEKKSRPIKDFFDSFNEVILKIIDLIMLFAPYGVFALIAKTISSVSGDISQISSILSALLFYMGVVIAGLFMHMSITYISILKIFTNISLKHFFKSIGPVQLVAFSTSSSGATLPVTMKRCEKDLGVSEEISSFVLPLGATINMDGTALYQGVAAVFIAQAVGMDLTFADQFTIVATAVLASIGTAAVPGAGIIMLVIILEAINVPSEGIALILGVERILDMIRTTTNVTGDATIACAMDSLEN